MLSFGATLIEAGAVITFYEGDDILHVLSQYWSVSGYKLNSTLPLVHVPLLLVLGLQSIYIWISLPIHHSRYHIKSFMASNRRYFKQQTLASLPGVAS